jgi:hypothetical protein
MTYLIVITLLLVEGFWLQKRKEFPSTLQELTSSNSPVFSADFIGTNDNIQSRYRKKSIWEKKINQTRNQTYIENLSLSVKTI